jgi:hypothetical protein
VAIKSATTTSCFTKGVQRVSEFITEILPHAPVGPKQAAL